MGIPDSSQSNNTQQGKLPLLSSLSKEASAAVVLPSIKSSSLISLGQLCDDDYRVILDKKKLYVEKDDKVVLEANRNLTYGLWDIPILYCDCHQVIKLIIKVELKKLMCYFSGVSMTMPNMFIRSLVFPGGSWCCDITAIARSLLCVRKILLRYVYFFQSLPITFLSPNHLIIWFV